MAFWHRIKVGRPIVEPIDPDTEWEKMGAAFRSGLILNASRADLVRYLRALATVMVMSEANRQRAQQMGETIRLLLARLDSQESHAEALGVARAALWVAVAALLVTAGQLYLYFRP